MNMTHSTNEPARGRGHLARLRGALIDGAWTGGMGGGAFGLALAAEQALMLALG